MSVLVGWSPPDRDWVALNSDGAVRRSCSTAAAGGVFRDSRGNWLGGFSTKLASCSAFRAELWGVLHGLQFAWSDGWRRLEVQVDNKSVVQVINQSLHRDFQHSDIISRIKTFMSRDWEVRIRHIYREANSVADCLANIAFSQHDRMAWHDTLPAAASLLALGDVSSVAHSRAIVM